MINALLIEDDLDLAGAVVDYLALEDIQCDHAANGVAGLELQEKNHYQLLILDLNLPRMDGLQVCNTLRARGDAVPILMLTARDSLEEKIAGFSAGTDDYLVKPFAMVELVARCRALANRRSGQVQRLQVADLLLDLESKTAQRNQRTLKLTPIAFRLLECLMRASPAAVSRADLLRAGWGEEPPDSNSLKVHIHNLRKAVDGDHAVKLLHTLPGAGFALRASEEEL